MTIPLDQAELLALFLENITYGAFLSLFNLLVVIPLGERNIHFSKQRFILPVATLMMLLATMHLTIDFVRALEGFVTGDPEISPHPIAYYQVISQPLHIAKTPVYALQTILGDTVLVWRFYVIYDKRLDILIPTTIILGTNLAIGIVVSWSISVADPGKNIFDTASPWIAAFFIITMILNVCCTGAIVVKIWCARRHATTASRRLSSVVAVIIESGAMYTTSILGLLIAYLSNSNGQYAALDLVTPLVGVTYCLIVLQVYLAQDIQSSEIRRWK